MNLLVDTIPTDARNRGAVNVGLRIAADAMGARVVHYADLGRVEEATCIGFNVFYPMHAFNVVAFLRRHGIPYLSRDRSPGIHPRIVIGGQGVTPILHRLADEVHRGEIEPGFLDRWRYARAETVASPLFYTGKKSATLELTRGCKHRCAFCEYGWVHGGPYRERPFPETHRLLTEAAQRGVRHVNLMTANLAGLSYLNDLMGILRKLGLNVLSSDLCLADFPAIEPHLKYFGGKTWKIGVESFDEATRREVGKRTTDAELERIIRALLERSSNLHLYLIYGLPGDRIDSWHAWTRRLGGIRRGMTEQVRTLFGAETRATKPVQFTFSMTNFEPCLGTPLERAPQVDFVAKERWLRAWIQTLTEERFFPPGYEWASGRDKGRYGRSEIPYRVLMALKRSRVEEVGALTADDVFRHGVTRSIDKDNGERFLRRLEIVKEEGI